MTEAPLEQSQTPSAACSGRRVLNYEQALRRALKLFVRSGNVDMQQLADDFPVGRATLYRLVGSRDRLLGDVLWTLAERTLRRAEQETTSVGIDRAVEISLRFKELSRGFPPVQRFLAENPQTALRVLLTPAGQVSERMVAAWAEIFRAAVSRGELTLPFDVDWFAYVYIRTGESMTYSDLLSGREPDLELAAYVQRALFHGTEPASGPWSRDGRLS